MQFGYQVNAYYWGWDASIDLKVDHLIDLNYCDLDWGLEYRHWSWYLQHLSEVDVLYRQLRCIRELTIDVVRYERELASVH
jgi:hypothetical protein